MNTDGSILVVNCGSSSIKFALFADDGAAVRRRCSGSVTRIGLETGRFTVADAEDQPLVDDTRPVADHHDALELILDWVETRLPGNQLRAVGHRIVHGGADCDCPVMITSAVEARLATLTPLAPLHLPHNLAGVAAVRRHRPSLPQVACFDTAFHHGLPRVARLTGLPRQFQDEGIRRYGFHGLSYEYVIGEVRRRHGGAAANAHIVVAHLGNGASMAAFRDGRSVETTMGFSTLAGLPMGTRTGDLDPGVLLYLLIEKRMPAAVLQNLLYDESGMLGVSGLSRNMADLLARQDDDPGAADAVEFFCHHARRHLGGLIAVLGGVERLVFTGGIGANSPEIRARICTGLHFLGVEVDESANGRNNRIISTDHSSVVIEAFRTDEEFVIAQHTRDVLGAAGTEQKVEAHG